MLSGGAVERMATEEAAATREPGGGPPHGPEGPEERVSVSLLILQRVDRVEQRIDHLEQRLERLEDKMDARFVAVDARFVAVDARFAAIEDKMDTRFAATDAKIDDLRRELSAKIDGQTAKMLWLFGLILVAVIAKVFIPHL